MNVSTEIHTPPHFSTSIFDTLPMAKVKIELGIHTVIHIFKIDSSDGDEPPYPLPFTSYSHPPSIPPLLPRLLCHLFLHPFPNPRIPLSNVHVLLPGRNNILKKLDYDTLQIEEVNFMALRFYGNQMFVLHLVGISSSHTKAKSMNNMDKRYEGYV